MATPADILLEEAKCYLCLGISQSEALMLAMLDRVSSAQADLVIDNINLDDQTPIDGYAHGFGSIPSDMRLVVVLDQAVGGWAAGYEIDGHDIWDATTVDHPFTIGANSTIIHMASNGGFQLGTVNTNQFTGAGGTTLSSATAHGKLYVWR